MRDGLEAAFVPLQACRTGSTFEKQIPARDCLFDPYHVKWYQDNIMSYSTYFMDF